MQQELTKARSEADDLQHALRLEERSSAALQQQQLVQQQVRGSVCANTMRCTQSCKHVIVFQLSMCHRLNRPAVLVKSALRTPSLLHCRGTDHVLQQHHVEGLTDAVARLSLCMPYCAHTQAASSSSSSPITSGGSRAGSSHARQWVSKAASSSSEKHHMLQQLQELMEQCAADEVR